MKKTSLFLLITLLLAACVRPAATPEAPPPPTSTLSDVVAPTAILAQVSDTPEEEEAEPTQEEEPTTEPSPSPFIITPTEENPVEPTSNVTKTPTVFHTPAPTVTSTQEPTPDQVDLDPLTAFGAARFDEQWKDGGANWITNSGDLPDTQNIKLEITDNIMAVTGKFQDFDTWWFSSPYLGDLYIEMTVNSGDCAGDDAYGLILRGPPKGDPAHGYIIGFTCDGRFFVRRVDSSNPYTIDVIFIPTETPYIQKGSGRQNILGVLIRKDVFTIYANGFEVVSFQDDTYDLGRYGIYVKAGPTDQYTYLISRLRVWDLRNK